MPEAMVFGTDIFAICDRLGLVVTCDKKPSVKDLFEKQRVGVDALNTSHHAGRQGPLSWAERRTNLGQRIIGLWLQGAVPIIIIDGPETAPGAGKYARIDERARAHNPLTVVPTKDQDAFWDANQPWWSRDKLGDNFQRWRVEFEADCQEAQTVCIIGGRGEAEAALAWFESDQEIGGSTSLSCLHRGAVSDKDWFGYAGREALRLKRGYDNPAKCWWEVHRRYDVLEGLGLATDDSMRCLLFLLGINDIPPPVEAILPAAARAAAAKAAYESAYGGANASPAAKQAYTRIRKTRVDAALETLHALRGATRGSPGWQRRFPTSAAATVCWEELLWLFPRLARALTAPLQAS